MFTKKIGIFAVFSMSLMSPIHNLMAEEVKVVNGQQFNVFVPNLVSSNEFTLGALFLRPGGSNDYAVLVSPFNPSVASPILSPSWETKGINPGFNPGFSLNFRHIFAESGNDINVYWAHLRTSDSDSFPVNRNPPPAQQFTGPIWNIGPDAGTTSGVNGELKNDYDVLNIEVAKHVNFEPTLKSRFFAGLSGIVLQQQTIANFIGTDPILGPYTFGITTDSKYRAVGFRFGAEGEYVTPYNVGIVGLLAGDLYIGSQKPNTSTTGTGSILDAAGIPVNNQSISHSSYVEVVPALEAKLGIKYSHPYSCDASFAIEAGYMASIYTNAIQNYVPSTYVPGSLGIVSGSVFLQSLLKSTHSFSLDGPYINISIKM